MNRVYIGIDNGVTGSIGIVDADDIAYFPMPVRKEQSYTKKKQQISRVIFFALRDALKAYNWMCEPRVFLERPYANPTGLKATVSAMRSLEATLIVLEMLGFSYEYIDSKQWQKAMLPSGLKGKELKDASRDIGIRLFPMLEDEIRKQKDADGLLIAEWARRLQL